MKVQEQKEKTLQLQQQKKQSWLQEAEPRLIEDEECTVGLQRKERQVHLLNILTSKKVDDSQAQDKVGKVHTDLLQPMLDMMQTVSAGCVSTGSPHLLRGQLSPSAPKETLPYPETECHAQKVAEDIQCRDHQLPHSVAPHDTSPEKTYPAILASVPDNNQHPMGIPNVPWKDTLTKQDKCNRKSSKDQGRARENQGREDRHKQEWSQMQRMGDREDRRQSKEHRSRKKHWYHHNSPHWHITSRAHAQSQRSHGGDRLGHRDRSQDCRGGSGRKRSHHQHSQRFFSGYQASTALPETGRVSRKTGTREYFGSSSHQNRGAHISGASTQKLVCVKTPFTGSDRVGHR